MLQPWALGPRLGPRAPCPARPSPSVWGPPANGVHAAHPGAGSAVPAPTDSPTHDSAVLRRSQLETPPNHLHETVPPFRPDHRLARAEKHVGWPALAPEHHAGGHCHGTRRRESASWSLVCPGMWRRFGKGPVPSAEGRTPSTTPSALLPRAPPRPQVPHSRSTPSAPRSRHSARRGWAGQANAAVGRRNCYPRTCL